MQINRRGFTLVELLVVMGIILILVALAIPAVNSARNRAKDTEVKAGCNTIQSALERYAVDHGGHYPGAHWERDANGRYEVGPALIGGLPTFENSTTPRKDFYVPHDNDASRGLSGLSGEPAFFPDGTANPNQVDALVVSGYLENYPANPFLRVSDGFKGQMGNLFLFDPQLGDTTPVPSQPDSLDFNRYTNNNNNADTMRINYVDYGRGHFSYIPLNPVNNTGFDYVGEWDTGSLSDAELSGYYDRCRGYMLVGWGYTRQNDTLAKGLSIKFWDPQIDIDNDGNADGAFDFDRNLTADQIEAYMSDPNGFLRHEQQDSNGDVGAFGQTLQSGGPDIDQAFFGAVFLKITGS